jgi:hypothetical protein
VSNNDKDCLASQSQAAQPSIKTWQERDALAMLDPMVSAVCMQAEINDLRIALAGQSQATKVQAVPAGWISICDGEIALSLTGPQREALLTRNGAPIYLAPTAQEVTQQAAPDMRDAYVGAREDIAIWKKRALEAEESCRRLTAALNVENGPTFMGDPVVTQQAAKAEPIIGAHAWYHRGMVNFDEADALKALDDGEGTAIPLYLAPTTSTVSAPTVEYVPIAVNPHDEAGGRHPNDKTPADPECQKALDARGDDSGQGLAPYWKWGFRAGWHDHKRITAPSSTVSAPDEIRNQALEEAAVICDQQSKEPECPERAEYCADAIRALQSGTASTKTGEAQ